MKLTSNSPPSGAYATVENLLQLRHLAKDIVLEPRKKSVAAMDGDALSRFRGRGMEFAEVRAYQPGDDVRNIDWRVTARTQKPYTKLFQEEKERPVLLVVDQRSNMFFGSQTVFKSVYAAQIAATVAWSASQNNDRIGALIFGDQEQSDLRAKRGKHALLGLLHKLQRFNTKLDSPNRQGKFSCYDIINDVRRVAKPGSAVFIISDFNDFSSDCEKSLAMLSRHCDSHLIKVFDPLEVHLPTSQISVSDGSQRLRIMAGSKDLYEQFHAAYQQRENFIRKACSTTKTACLRADTSVALKTWINDVFKSTSTRYHLH